jgi:hypothetical protein
LNVNRIVTRGAFSVGASSFAAFLFAGNKNKVLGDVITGAILAGIGIGSLSALFEKYAFKN